MRVEPGRLMDMFLGGAIRLQFCKMLLLGKHMNMTWDSLCIISNTCMWICKFLDIKNAIKGTLWRKAERQQEDACPEAHL